jgi:hypothetical protein
LKTKDEVFKAYVAYLKEKISVEKPKTQKVRGNGYTTRKRVVVLKSR